MKTRQPGKLLRIAVHMDIEWSLKRHYEVLTGIQRYARGKPEWKLTIDPLIDLEHAGVLGRHFDAMIGRLTARMAQAARRAGIPAVQVAGSPMFKTIAQVAGDAAGRGRIAAAHLLECGYRHLGFLTDPSYTCEITLCKAMAQAAARAGATFRPFALPDIHRYNIKNRIILQRYTRWLKDGPLPVGIYCSTDGQAAHLLNLCQTLGLRIPEDVGILGLGDDEPICENLMVALSSINTGCESHGYRAAQVLDLILRGKLPADHHENLPPGEVVVRRSTDIRLVDDPQVTAAMRVIHRDFRQEISQPQIARLAGMNLRNLQRRFKKVTGRTLHDELIRYRLEAAQRLMIRTHLNLNRVAELSGLKNAKHMNVVFRRVEGKTPAIWREEKSRRGRETDHRKNLESRK